MTSSCGRRSRYSCASAPLHSDSAASAAAQGRPVRDMSACLHLVVQAEEEIAAERLVVADPARVLGVVDGGRVGEVVDLEQDRQPLQRRVLKLVAGLQVGDLLVAYVFQGAAAGEIGDFSDVVGAVVRGHP